MEWVDHKQHEQSQRGGMFVNQQIHWLAQRLRVRESHERRLGRR